MYKLLKDMNGNVTSVLLIEQKASIPFDPANTDYQTFKKDIAEGKTLQDADGNEMTAEAAQEFMRNLP
ncbi:MAG: hypothetical protein ACO22M_00400 [Candidatus Nanopelagicaceae bacterium]